MANNDNTNKPKRRIGEVFRSDRDKIIEEKIKKMNLMAEGKDIRLPDVAQVKSHEEDEEDERDKDNDFF